MHRLVPILLLALVSALLARPGLAQSPPASAFAAVPAGDEEFAPMVRGGRMGRHVMEGVDGLEAMAADRKPMERLRAEIGLYHEARGITDPRKRQSMLDELDGRPTHRDVRASLVRMLRKADNKPNPLYQLRLVQAGMAWLVEVDGESTAAVPEMEQLRTIPARSRPNTPEMDRVLHRIAMLIEQSSRSGRPTPASARPSARAGDPSAAPGAPGNGAGARNARGLFALLVLLGTLALGMHVGDRRAHGNLPVRVPHAQVPAAPAGAPAPAPGPAPAPAIAARPAPLPTVAVQAPARAGAFLPLLRDTMEVYVSRIHRVKNHLSIAARFEGDPEGLVANLFEAENFRELTAFLERSRAELARLVSRASGAADLPAGFATLLARGERVLAGALATLKRLEAEHLTGAAPDLPPRAEEEVGRLAREVRTFSSDLCAVSDRHAFAPRELVEEVVGRATFRDAVSIAAPEALPASLLVTDAERAKAGLASALGNLLDNAHQAGARRITVALAFMPGAPSGELTLSVTDDGPGVAAAVRDRLFAPRVTTRAEGTGMGLFGARKALQELGGDAGHTAPAAGGAEFWLKVPALAA